VPRKTERFYPCRVPLRSPPESERRPTPAPLEVNEGRIVAVGMAVWVAAIGVLLGLRATSAAYPGDRWLWTCAIGIAIGLYGLRLTRKRRKRIGNEEAQTARDTAES
jgi:hypothetical protein